MRNSPSIFLCSPTTWFPWTARRRRRFLWNLEQAFGSEESSWYACTGRKEKGCEINHAINLIYSSSQNVSRPNGEKEQTARRCNKKSHGTVCTQCRMLFLDMMSAVFDQYGIRWCSKMKKKPVCEISECSINNCKHDALERWFTMEFNLNDSQSLIALVSIVVVPYNLFHT